MRNLSITNEQYTMQMTLPLEVLEENVGSKPRRTHGSPHGRVV